MAVVVDRWAPRLETAGVRAPPNPRPSTGSDYGAVSTTSMVAGEILPTSVVLRVVSLRADEQKPDMRRRESGRAGR